MLMEFLNRFKDLSYIIENVAITVAIVFVLFALQRLSLKYLSRKKWASETLYLQVHAHVRNAYLTLITISVITIWIPQIQAFALSIAAIAVAFVVSLKEIIMMLTGGFIRTSTDTLSIGDRIEIGHCKGDVMRTGFFTTDLLEVGECGQRTGRLIHVPNSHYFTYPVINETAVSNFTFHVMDLPVAIARYNPKLKEELLAYMKEITAPYIQQAEKEFERFAKKNAMTILRVEPRILLKSHTFEAYQMTLRMPVPILEKILIEQKIIQKYLELLSGTKVSANTNPTHSNQAQLQITPKAHTLMS